MNLLKETLSIADIHADRIQYALNTLKSLFPLTKESLLSLSMDDFLVIELLVSRFSKLQDYMGKKILDLFLQNQAESIEELSMIDKLNKLERLGLIDKASIWIEMREVRNHLTHEYPEHPELTASYLNDLYLLAPILLSILNQIKLRTKND